MKPDAIPVRIDQMPREAREPSAAPIFSVRFLIALAINSIPFKFWGRLIGEDSVVVSAVMDALKRGGWKIVPMEREDFK